MVCGQDAAQDVLAAVTGAAGSAGDTHNLILTNNPVHQLALLAHLQAAAAAAAAAAGHNSTGSQ
jgi:hypothetical protein